MAQDRCAAIGMTLRWVASMAVNGDLNPAGLDETELRRLADAVESGERWVCCPLCQEVACDDDCPLAPVRDGAPSDGDLADSILRKGAKGDGWGPGCIMADVGVVDIRVNDLTDAETAYLERISDRS